VGYRPPRTPTLPFDLRPQSDPAQKISRSSNLREVGYLPPILRGRDIRPGYALRVERVVGVWSALRSIVSFGNQRLGPPLFAGGYAICYRLLYFSHVSATSQKVNSPMLAPHWRVARGKKSAQQNARTMLGMEQKTQFSKKYAHSKKNLEILRQIGGF